MENGWTEKIRTLEKKVVRQEDEIRILKLRLEAARKIMDEIAAIADRIN